MDKLEHANAFAGNRDCRAGGNRRYISRAWVARRLAAASGGLTRAGWLTVAVVVAAASSPGCRSSTGLAAGGVGASLTSPQTLAAAVAIVNREGEVAKNVRVTKLALAGGTLSDPLPIDLGTIAPGESVPVHASFAGKFAPRGSYPLSVEGTYDEANGSKRFKFDIVLVVPPDGPGSGFLKQATVDPAKVSGAPFPPQTPKFDEEEVNQANWTVPTGPDVAGPPAPASTTIQRTSGKLSAPMPHVMPIVFDANSSLGLSSAGPGPVSTVAEPSGASNGGSVIFSTANWVAAYSSNGGGSFTQVNPTTIFPADAVGYCCDQVVQYVPSIDRFIWFLQGNGYRMASASPSDIVAFGATAWTYWNLTPTVFGQPNGTGFDYPDLSVGDNYLYMSWDVGFGGCPPGCRSGFQVTRTSLAGILAGGSITLEFTDPPDSPMAWGGHLMQDTGNEIFWAGHNSTSSMRVFSLAEGSGSYFWRDVAISSWPNNALSSITPDGRNWVAGSGGFPGNAIIGSTRVGNQLWFAWTAGTNNRFQQPHVEIAVLDRSASFGVLQRLQIWNNSYGFAYPSLATNACTREVGLSLEYGGPSDFENHVVGFWGDFVVYSTTGSNVGTTRFGDYVTIRQQPRTSANPGNLLNAFGYGLDTTPGGGTQTDAHYVLFGRPGDQCR